MNARTLQATDEGTPLEVLSPVLFNTFKHHAGTLRARIAAIIAQGHDAFLEMASRLAVIGTRLMDLYIGELSPRDLSTWIRAELSAIDRLDLDRYRAWLLAHDDYATFTHPGDGSRWVLRLGDEQGRFVHLHPGRWSPLTVRVKANVLKTAFLVLCHTGIHGGNPMDREVLNEVRQSHLGLSPLGADPEGDLGLGVIIRVLRTP
jgi:hypothetical protein